MPLLRSACPALHLVQAAPKVLLLLPLGLEAPLGFGVLACDLGDSSAGIVARLAERLLVLRGYVRLVLFGSWLLGRFLRGLGSSLGRGGAAFLPELAGTLGEVGLFLRAFFGIDLEGFSDFRLGLGVGRDRERGAVGVRVLYRDGGAGVLHLVGHFAL